jgi:pimeloyl-ACP methyl ester carboxylesterase
MLVGLQPFFDSMDVDKPETRSRESVLAALNGVMGDHLVAIQSPFSIPMTLRFRGERLDWHAPPLSSEVTGKVLVLIHGLCMTDHQWHTKHDDQVVDHGESLAAALGFSPVYLRYNSGLHVSQNGRELSVLLEQLVTGWPTPIEELTVIAHSMGGLLIRSALLFAKQDSSRWPDRLKKIVFLGTPHHGAPLEQAGNWVDRMLAATPYTAPFAKLGHLRSAGITDLRYGHVLDEDWQGRDRFLREPDHRRAVPLPEGVACFTVAASTAGTSGGPADRLIGDGLVPVNSALGRHVDPERSLDFPPTSQRIQYRTNHLGLLSSAEVSRKIMEWLTPDVPAGSEGSAATQGL